MLVAAAMLLESQYSSITFSDDIGRYVPFFEDVATWTGIKGISFSIAEVFMLILLVATLLRIASNRTLRFDKGSLMRPIGLYMLMVVVGEVVGLASGGDFRLSLWEVRSQVYMFVAYILTCNLIRTRKQIDMLLWIVLVGTGLRGVQGVWRYLITLGGNIHKVEALFSHEQSFFFNAYLTLTAILFLYGGGSRRMKQAALFFLPFVLVASLANQRRAAILAFGVGLIGLLFITAVVNPKRRRMVVIIVLTLAVAWEPYYAAFKNSSGLTGEIAHAVASASSPDQRDANSNLYRVNEDKDIMATMRTSPIIGYGFGKPMLVPYPLPGIATVSSAYGFWNILPHDSILWVWMRMGTVGYILLWFMVGTAIVQAAGLARRLQDPYLKGLAVWIVLMTMQQIVFGYLDLQWTNYRNLITLGVLFALVGRLTTVVPIEGSATPSVSGVIARVRRSPQIPRSLAVVDGRLRR